MTALLKKLSQLIPVALLAITPISPNYQLKSYTFQGDGSASSANYQVEGETGVGTGDGVASPSYSIGASQLSTQLAEVATATLSNPTNDYYGLHLVLDAVANPSDAEFAVAISSDGFASDTRYVQSTNTVGATLGAEDWRTYTAWGGASGVDVTGLATATTYTVKVTARSGSFTQTQYGPTTALATEAPSLTIGSVPSSLSFQIAPNTEDTNAVPLSIQTNADRYTLKLYADNGAAGANPRDAATGDLISNSGGFSPPDVNTETTFTSGTGMGYRMDSVVGSEIANFAADAYKSLAYGTLGSHPNAVTVMTRWATRPNWATDTATITFKMRADFSIAASANYQTTAHFEVTPSYDGL